MNNYEYIIASLPALQPIGTPGAAVRAGSASELLSGIRELLSERDKAAFDLMQDGYDPEKLGEEFYSKALRHHNRFIREFFAYDLDMRNLKVEYLNRELGRPEGTDMVVLPEREDCPADTRAEVAAVLSCSDILKRERGLDELLWKKIDEITVMEIFSLELILGFTAKLKLIDRWEKLDPDTGAEFFRKLVQEIRSTYDNKKNNMI